MGIDTSAAARAAVTELSSEVLAAAAQSGDSRALASLLERHKHEVFRVALRMTGRPYDADEVVQLSLERVLKHLARYDRSRPFRPWLLRIAVNQARTFLRRRAVRELFLGTDVAPRAPGPSLGPEAGLFQRDLRGELDQALQELPASQREAFVLKHVEELSYEEMAEITGDSVGSLKVRVHRARRTLLESLKLRRVTPPPVREY
jgi:RNA polymerase sigma-70 factor (ECF subfamily)